MIRECEKLTFSSGASLGIAHHRLFGSNLEHTRGSIYGGLSAQMLKNRKFVGCPSAMEGCAVDWYLIGEAPYGFFCAPYTHHDYTHYHMSRWNECNAQGVMNAAPGVPCGIGQHEVSLVAGNRYDVAVVVKTEGTLTVTVALTDRWGKSVYAAANREVRQEEGWVRFAATLPVAVTDPDADLRITFEDCGVLQIGAASLMNADNFRGMRKDVVACLKEMGIKVLRWPGGNFAGEYNWFDGLLPVDERAPFGSYMSMETQPLSLGFDFHEINTDDFVALCREIGAEPYITINPVWNTPEESAAWVEYCNGDETTTYGKIRAERGFIRPYGVKLWSLGNEMGYGHMEGDNTPEGYARLARRNAEAMLAICPDLELCSSGPHPNGDWVEHAVKPLADAVGLVSLHMYVNFGNPCSQYACSDRLDVPYREAVGGVQAGRSLARTMRDLMGDCPTKISFDEWNIWHAWRRPSCVIDGMYTAGMLHALMAEAESCGIGVACQFESVNESAIQVKPNEAFLTATGQAFSIMKHHCGGVILAASNEAVATEQEGVVTVTVINYDCEAAKTYALDCGQGMMEATLFEGRSLMPHSRFEEREMTLTDGMLEIPPHSVALIRYRV